MKFLFLFALCLLTGTVDAVDCAQDGSSYSYTESVSTDQKTRTITTNWCPNHPNFNNNPNKAVVGSSTLTIPAKPEIVGSVTEANPSATNTATASKSLAAQGGRVGIFFSSAMLYSPYGMPCCQMELPT